MQPNGHQSERETLILACDLVILVKIILTIKNVSFSHGAAATNFRLVFYLFDSFFIWLRPQDILKIKWIK